MRSGSALSDGLAPWLGSQDVLILDGGLATELEARGWDLRDGLWSARLLADAPDAIRDVHRAYLEAGADCLTGASYQASLPGFAARGLSEARARELLVLSVRLALEVRDAFWREPARRHGRLRPLVAASVGPYGAFLANGAEYTGDYGLSEAELFAFHRPRFEALREAGAELMACETIPSRLEARALARLVGESRGVPAWLSFSCRDGQHICDGSPIADVVAEVQDAGWVAMGVNCTAPRHLPSLLRAVRDATALPLVAYPNSGETYQTATRAWTGDARFDLAAAAVEWRRLGARLIGGCCRTGPDDIRRLRAALLAPREERPR